MTKVKGRLLIVGDGPLRNRLESLAVSLGVSDNVIFLGEIQNELLVPYYHATKVFVLPSVARSEAFGIVQLEAMACGKPVVNTSLDSGVPFVSLDGITGFTVPPADSNALSNAINMLLEDSALNAQFGQAALRRVEREFNLELMVSRLICLYHDVLNVAEDRCAPPAVLARTWPPPNKKEALSPQEK
jgi:rhamnosyl/mannosyltransferase